MTDQTHVDLAKQVQTDSAVRAAQSLPDLIVKLDAADPALAQTLRGKALIASRSAPGVLLAGVAAYASSRWGFGWDPDLDALIAGAGVLAAGYAMRSITSAPITGLFTRKPVPPEPVAKVTPS